MYYSYLLTYYHNNDGQNFNRNTGMKKNWKLGVKMMDWLMRAMMFTFNLKFKYNCNLGTLILFILFYVFIYVKICNIFAR